MYYITAVIPLDGVRTTHYWNGGIYMLLNRDSGKKFTADEAIAAFPQARRGWNDVEIVPAAANLYEQLHLQGHKNVATLVGADCNQKTFCDHLRNTPVLPAGFKVSDAARAYLETVRKSLE